MIEHATHRDLDLIRTAYDHGRSMQRLTGSPLWPEFSLASILSQIDDRRLYRVVDGGEIAGVFSVAYDDAAIWGDLERGEHIYLHRIARSPVWKGRGLIEVILAWADDHCRGLGRSGLRMDTWASNAPLIAFYQRQGFRFLGTVHIGVDPRLELHYHGNDFALLERNCIP